MLHLEAAKEEKLPVSLRNWFEPKHAQATAEVEASLKRRDRSVAQLQQWHAVSGDIGHDPYDPSALVADEFEGQAGSMAHLWSARSLL